MKIVFATSPDTADIRFQNHKRATLNQPSLDQSWTSVDRKIGRRKGNGIYALSTLNPGVSLSPRENARVTAG
jgi:hypothetical protein